MGDKKCCRLKCSFKIALIIFLGIIAFIYINLNKKRLEPCDISPQKTESLRVLIKTVSHALEMHNVTYWVDYGTVLGAYRYCDVIPWDHDADIGYLESERKKVKQAAAAVNLYKKISMSETQASYGNYTLDLFVWKKVKDWWSFSSIGNFLTRREDTADNYKLDSLHPKSNAFKIFLLNLFLEHLPFNFLNTRTKVRIADFEVYTLRSAEELVRWRYPLTYDKVVPFFLYCLNTFYNSTGGMNKCVE
jgi:hypothetical protein